MSVVTDLQVLLEAANKNVWREHDKGCPWPVFTGDCNCGVNAAHDAAEELQALVPILAHTVLTLTETLKREHSGPLFDLHVKGQEKATLPRCDTCAALRLPELAEAMEGK